MLIQKPNGRESLLERIRSRFGADKKPSLANVVRVVDETVSEDRIQDTSHQLVIEAWPIGSPLRRTIDIAICIGLGWDDDEWDEPPGQIVVSFKTSGGIIANFMKRYSAFLDTEEIDDACAFLDQFRASPLFRRYANKPAEEFSVNLWGGDEFFDMMGKVIPAMKEAGIWTCCDGTCDVAESQT